MTFSLFVLTLSWRFVSLF